MGYINIISNRNSTFNKYYSIYKNKILPNKKKSQILTNNIGLY